MRGGLSTLIELLIRLAIWHLVFRSLGGFLTRYTHVPWLGAVVALIAVVVGYRLGMRWYRNRRS